MICIYIRFYKILILLSVSDDLSIHVYTTDLKNARGKVSYDIQRYTCIDLYIKLRNA